ncbi:hypothetical protein Tco_1253267 [Tanacetum coccineum]
MKIARPTLNPTILPPVSDKTIFVCFKAKKTGKLALKRDVAKPSISPKSSSRAIFHLTFNRRMRDDAFVMHVVDCPHNPGPSTRTSTLMKKHRTGCTENSKLVEKEVNSDMISSVHGTSSKALDDDRTPLKKVDDLVNADSDSAVDDWTRCSINCRFYGINEFQDPYDDDDEVDNCGLTDAQLKFANAFDIGLKHR